MKGAENNNFDNINLSQISLNQLPAVKIDYERGKVMIGEDTYTVTYNQQSLENHDTLRQKVLQIVEKTLNHLGSELDPRFLDKMKIDNEFVHYHKGSKELTPQIKKQFVDMQNIANRSLRKENLPQIEKAKSEDNFNNISTPQDLKNTEKPQGNISEHPNVLSSFKELIIKTYPPQIQDDTLSHVLSQAREGEKLIKEILHGNLPAPSVDNLRKISWFLVAKSAEQGEFVFRGALRFKDPNKQVFKWLQTFNDKGLYRRISTHFNAQSATKEKKNFLGWTKGPMLQHHQYGIEDYDRQLPGGQGSFLFDELKDGSIYIKLESVGVPTKKSATAIANEIAKNSGSSKVQEKEYVKKSKEHHHAHIGNFLIAKVFTGKEGSKIIGKVFKGAVEDNLKITKAVGSKKFWYRREKIPKDIKKAFREVVKGLYPNKKEQKKIIHQGEKGFKKKDGQEMLGGISAMKEILSSSKSNAKNKFDSLCEEFYKNTETGKEKQDHGLARVGNEVILDIKSV